MRNLPFHDIAQNRIWVAIAALAADLLAATARLALPTAAAAYEPKRLRLRILAVAGRIVRTARRRMLKIDPAWPWATVITTAHGRLVALPFPDKPIPAPTTPPEHRSASRAGEQQRPPTDDTTSTIITGERRSRYDRTKHRG
ncbi:transposase [Pseudonocardia sp. GCM10023141]|uniref:transposase n=1 Tax=Pseudonocardia sp. GCM10023141 TaxID=3252653 RepID=UPI00361A7C1D